VLLRSDDALRRASDAELADIYAFLFAQMGEPGFAPPPPPAPPAAEPAPSEPTPAPRS